MANCLVHIKGDRELEKYFKGAKESEMLGLAVKYYEKLHGELEALKVSINPSYTPKEFDKNLVIQSEAEQGAKKGEDVNRSENPALKNVESTTKAIADAIKANDEISDEIEDLFLRENGNYKMQFRKIAESLFYKQKGLTGKETKQQLIDKGIDIEEYGEEWNLFIKNNEAKILAEQYHKAKKDGTNPELVNSLEELLAPKIETTSDNQKPTEVTSDKKSIEKVKVKDLEVGDEVVLKGKEGTWKVAKKTKDGVDLSHTTKQGSMFKGADDGDIEGKVVNRSENLQTDKKDLPLQNKIEYAKQGNELQRLSKESEQGRSESGAINAVATIITEAVHRDVQEKQGISNPNAYGKIKQLEEVALLKYAEDNGLMLELPSTEIIGDGNESDVYLHSDPTLVTKVTFPNNYNSWLEMMDSIAIHNAENPNTQYQIKGFTKNKDGEFSIVVEQNKIESKPATFEKIHEDLLNKGYEQSGDYGDGRYIHKDKGIVLEDVKEDNVHIDKDGNLFYIDTDYYPYDKQRGGSIIVNETIQSNTSNLETTQSETESTSDNQQPTTDTKSLGKDFTQSESLKEAPKAGSVGVGGDVEFGTAFNIQDATAENTVGKEKALWGKAQVWRERIENAGDILRELSSRGDKPDVGYLMEKVKKIRDWIAQSKKGYTPIDKSIKTIEDFEKTSLRWSDAVDSREYIEKFHSSVLDKIRSEYEAIPTYTKEQRLAVELVLDLINNNIKGLESKLNEIENISNQIKANGKLPIIADIKLGKAVEQSLKATPQAETTSDKKSGGEPTSDNVILSEKPKIKVVSSNESIQHRIGDEAFLNKEYKTAENKAMGDHFNWYNQAIDKGDYVIVTKRGEGKEIDDYEIRIYEKNGKHRSTETPSSLFATSKDDLIAFRAMGLLKSGFGEQGVSEQGTIDAFLKGMDRIMEGKGVTEQEFVNRVKAERESTSDNNITPSKPQPDAFDKAADATIAALKKNKIVGNADMRKGDTMMGGNGEKIIRAAFDASRVIYHTTKSLAEAIKKALKTVRDSDWYKNLSGDQKSEIDNVVRKQLNDYAKENVVAEPLEELDLDMQDQAVKDQIMIEAQNLITTEEFKDAKEFSLRLKELYGIKETDAKAIYDKLVDFINVQTEDPFKIALRGKGAVTAHMNNKTINESSEDEIGNRTYLANSFDEMNEDIDAVFGRIKAANPNNWEKIIADKILKKLDERDMQAAIFADRFVTYLNTYLADHQRSPNYTAKALEYKGYRREILARRQKFTQEYATYFAALQQLKINNPLTLIKESGMLTAAERQAAKEMDEKLKGKKEYDASGKKKPFVEDSALDKAAPTSDKKDKPTSDKKEKAPPTEKQAKKAKRAEVKKDLLKNLAQYKDNSATLAIQTPKIPC